MYVIEILDLVGFWEVKIKKKAYDPLRTQCVEIT